MNKRSVDLEASANIGRAVKASTKKISLKKPATKKGSAPAKKGSTKKTTAAKEKTPAESTPSPKPTPKPEPNKIASSGKAYQPTLPGMRNLKQFKDTSAK
jgi:cell division septation protein DedD